MHQLSQIRGLKGFSFCIWFQKQREKITLIEKANFLLLFLQRILPPMESGPGTKTTSMPMEGHPGVCQKTNKMCTGT